jgi:hypothetical protein
MRGKIGTAAFVLYGTMLFLVLLIPQSVSTWAEDLKATYIRAAILPAISKIANFSSLTGIDKPYNLLRQAFLDAHESDDRQ